MDELTTLRRDEAHARSVEQRKQIARDRWESLPTAIKDTFTNAPKVSMYEALRHMDVDAQPSRAVEWAYQTRKDSLIVTVWHEQIRADLGPELLLLHSHRIMGQSRKFVGSIKPNAPKTCAVRR